MDNRIFVQEDAVEECALNLWNCKLGDGTVYISSSVDFQKFQYSGPYLSTRTVMSKLVHCPEETPHLDFYSMPTPYLELFGQYEGMFAVAKVDDTFLEEHCDGLTKVIRIRGSNISICMFAITCGTNLIKKIYYLDGLPNPFVIVHFTLNVHSLVIIPDRSSIKMKIAFWYLIWRKSSSVVPPTYLFNYLNYCVKIASSAFSLNVENVERDCIFTSTIVDSIGWNYKESYCSYLSKENFEKGVFQTVPSIIMFLKTPPKEQENFVVLRQLVFDHPSLPVKKRVFYFTEFVEPTRILSDGVFVQYTVTGNVTEEHTNELRKLMNENIC